MALPGVTEASWTEENGAALDEFVADTSIRTVVVYLDAFTGRLQVVHAMPSQVRHTLHSTPQAGSH